MTAKQILDAFSESLMQDPRILSPHEHELLANLLQNSKTAASTNPEVQSAVSATIARAVGETVAQRAFSLLGSNIVEQILARSGISSHAEEFAGRPIEVMSHSPQPPGGPKPSPQPPNIVPAGSPQPPNPGPFPPPPSPSPGPSTTPRRASQDSLKNEYAGTPMQHALQREPVGTGIGVLDRPFAQSVVLDEFLAPQELDELLAFTLEHEADLAESEVISPAGELGVRDYTHRRSRVLMNLGKREEVILDRIRGVLPFVFDQLGIEPFPITRAEAQITASNDGDFFAAHTDDGQEAIDSRRLTFVYFFHREPRPFEGGQLLLHGANSNGGSAGTVVSQTISPRQNQIVFFPCSILHEITPVNCPSRAFADSRFTLNGWLHN